MNKLSVLLCDDHEVVRAGYRRLLESTPDVAVTAEAVDGEEACRKYQEARPDVVIMDLNMPGLGGLEAARRILSRDPGARILVFSVHENEVMLSRALSLGVLGYISKRSASRVMVEAVRQVAAGRIYVGQELVPLLVRHGSNCELSAVAALSRREFEVFRLLVDGKSVNDIAGVLAISPKTAGHHVTSIKSKLDIPDLVGLTRLAIRLGIINP
jgi:two-component system invasion response regulator UvrY